MQKQIPFIRGVNLGIFTKHLDLRSPPPPHPSPCLAKLGIKVINLNEKNPTKLLEGPLYTCCRKAHILVILKYMQLLLCVKQKISSGEFSPIIINAFTSIASLHSLLFLFP